MIKKIRIVTAVCLLCLLTGCEKTNYIKEGTTLLEEEQYESAIDMFEDALEEEQDAGEAYRGIGLARYELEEYAEALEAFENALKCEAEQTPTIYNLMGICDMQMEEYQSALNNFRVGIDAAEAAEKDYSAIIQEMKYNEIVCYEMLLDWSNAKAKMEEYISQYPDDEAAQREAQFLRTR